MEKTYQLKFGKPFALRDIDRLFFACSYLDSDKSFLMEKEKFQNFLQNGVIREHREAIGF